MKTEKTKVINLYGGPGTGKSTTAAGVFHLLKLAGVNCEYVQEYAKDKAWEHGNTGETPKVFLAQEYIFGKQHFRIRRCADDVSLLVTDSPLLQGLVYMPEDFELPSLRAVVKEAYALYDNLDVFLSREKSYNPKGRLQTEEKAVELDSVIFDMLREHSNGFLQVLANEGAPQVIVDQVRVKGWV